MTGGDRGEQLEIGRRVLLVAERRRHDPPGRVVDRADEGQPRPAALEPVVPAAVELEEQALGRHPLAAAPVARRSVPARAGDARRPQRPPDGRPADDDPFALGEQLGEVGVVDRPVRRPPELDDPGPQVGRQTPARRPVAVAMDEAGRPVALERRPQPPDLALGQPERPGRLDHRQFMLQDPGQYPCSALLLGGHRDRRLHSRRLTKSLTSWP